MQCFHQNQIGDKKGAEQSDLFEQADPVILPYLFHGRNQLNPFVRVDGAKVAANPGSRIHPSALHWAGAFGVDAERGPLIAVKDNR